MPSAIYIHIPFCKTHCPYCDFAVWTIPQEKSSQEYPSTGAQTKKTIRVQEYIKSLCQEIEKRSQTNNKKEYIKTIYFGGGTPSILEIEQLQQITKTLHNNFEIATNAEITLETNPGTVDLNKLSKIKDLGFNRLSIGVQTFDENLLQKLARGHNRNDALQALRFAKEAGFENISLDLIFGLPGQTMLSWENTIEMALANNIQHISCYALTLEEGTPFYKMYSQSSESSNQINKKKSLGTLPDEELTAQMYEKLQEKLYAAGFEQYEISNFAKSGFESQHNMVYWRNQEFYGFGVSAHEFVNGQRKSHNRELEDYIKDPLKQDLLDCNIALEELMLKLRTKEGLNLLEYKDKFDIDLLTTKEKQLKQFQNLELINISNNVVRLTSKGFILSTYLIGELT